MKIAASVVLCLVAATAHAQGTSFEPIDLNQPGVLEGLKASDPERYDQVSRILQVAERNSCNYVGPQLFKAAGIDVQEAKCMATLLTSYPAKRQMGFAIGDTHYVALVTMQDSMGFLVPAKE
jgi:hypothetical protein